jgi:hypothetical protein
MVSAAGTQPAVPAPVVTQQSGTATMTRRRCACGLLLRNRMSNNHVVDCMPGYEPMLTPVPSAAAFLL